MTDEKRKFTIDGTEIECEAGKTILEAADDAGVYIPRLCHFPGIPPHGSCRVCTCKVNGRMMAACTTPVENGMTVVNDDPELFDLRRAVIEMLFAEGNHYCMFCEMSGNCELQAMAYRHKILNLRYPHFWQKREIDASHPDILLELNRCIMCARCVQVNKIVDHKHELELVGRGIKTRISVNSATGLSDTRFDVNDKAVSACPVGCILVKETGFQIPIGEREFDLEPIGSEIETKSGSNGKK